MIIGWLLASIVVLVAKKASRTVWIIYAGIVVLVMLCLPDVTLIDISSHLQPLGFGNPITFTFLLTIPVAIVVAALLLYSGLTNYAKRQSTDPEDDTASIQHRHTGRNFLPALILSALIVAMMLYNFYWFLIWDSTEDPIGFVWLFIPTLIVLFSSILLISLLPGNATLAGVSYLLLIPALMVVTTRAQGVNFRQLTETHAEQVRQAIEAYHTREGRYPENIRQLIPEYSISLPGPVIIFGQDWCYQGSKDYYRLGYLDRDHWSSLILFGRVYSSKGHSPLKVDVCQQAIDFYRTEHPEWDRAMQDYGKPTPTPDMGK